MSSLTLNTTADRQQDRPRPCDRCSLFHPGHCPFVSDGGAFNVKAFLGWKTVVEYNRDGAGTLSKFWKDKLLKFTFPRMSLGKADQDEVIKALEAAIKKLPKKTYAELKALKEQSYRVVNQVATDDPRGAHVLWAERNKLINVVKGLESSASSKSSAKSKSKSKSKTKTKTKGPSKKAQEEESSSSEEDSEHEDGSESEEEDQY